MIGAQPFWLPRIVQLDHVFPAVLLPFVSFLQEVMTRLKTDTMSYMRCLLG